MALPGPAGEENHLDLDARGLFLCISLWNSPLSILIGHVAAVLMALIRLIAMPVAQTPVIALDAVRLLVDAGILQRGQVISGAAGKWIAVRIGLFTPCQGFQFGYFLLLDCQ